MFEKVKINDEDIKDEPMHGLVDKIVTNDLDKIEQFEEEEKSGQLPYSFFQVDN